jgi:hypothetical protein
MVHAGNMYRWVDKDGKVHYTDQLPPPEAQSAERKKLGDKGVDLLCQVHGLVRQRRLSRA